MIWTRLSWRIIPGTFEHLMLVLVLRPCRHNVTFFLLWVLHRLEQTFLTTRKRLRVGEASFGVEEESPKSRARKDVAEGVLSPRDTNAAQTAFSSGKKKAAAPIVSKVAEENSPPPQDDQPSAPSSDFTQPLIDAARSAVDKLSFRAMQKDLKVCTIRFLRRM